MNKLNFITVMLMAEPVALTNVVAQDVVRHDSIAEVVVRGDARAKDVMSSAPVYTISNKDFRRMGVTDIATALHRIPSVTLRDYGGAGGMKTVSVRGFGAQHTGVVYDGVALSDCQTGHIDLSRYSLDNIRSLSLSIGDNEDIFIPAKNASTAATLNLNTLRQPADDKSWHVAGKMKFGSWGITNPFVRIEKNLSEKFGFNVVADYFYAENDYPYTIRNVDALQSDRRNNNWMNAGHGEMNFMLKPSAKNLFSLKLYYYGNSRRLPGDVNYYVNESKERERDKNFFAQFRYRQLLFQNVNTLSLAYVAKFNFAKLDYKDPSYSGGIMDHKYWQREAYTSACLLYTAGKNLSFDYSADYFFNNLTGSDQSTYRDPVRHTVLQSLTAKYTDGRLTAIARALCSLYFNKVADGASAEDIRHLSPSFSLNYQLLSNEKLFVRLSYKDIFRSPSFNEQYYKHYGSVTLKPECTRQVNLGMTWSRLSAGGSGFSLTADVYKNWVTDKIVAVPQTMFMWTNINLGKVRSTGVDITGNVTQRLAKRHTLIFACNYTYQKTVNRTDKQSPYYNLQVAYTPEHFGGASLAWENPWLNVAVSGLGVDDRWANNEHYDGTRLKGYAEFGIAAYRDLTVGKARLSLRFDLKNLFDKQYEIVRFYPMPGRSWQTTAKVSF